MAHFAKINENNIVEEVIVVHNNELIDENGQESESKGISFCQSLFGGHWIQTSYNASFRKNYAGKGYIWDSQKNAFYEPQPFNSWILDEETFKWQPPTPRPIEGRWNWNEETLSWIEIVGA